MRGLGLPKKRMRIDRIEENTLVLCDDDGKTEKRLNMNHLDRTASWTVHRPRKIEIRVGDKLLLQQNNRPAGYKNGDLVTVTDFNSDAILLSDGKTIFSDYTQYTFGWAVTSYASQGLTCDKVAVSYDQGSFAGIDRRGFYVSVSRGREDVRIFTDDKDFVRDCLGRNTGERTTASELVSETLPDYLVENLHRQRAREISPTAAR